jgi:formylglycine-generating enzyme required for sulfatase activity
MRTAAAAAATGMANKRLPSAHSPPNSFGLYDMVGNVWEWVEDCYRGGYDFRGGVDPSPTDGTAWEGAGCSKQVVRGGSWSSDPVNLRSAARSEVQTDLRRNNLGFRVAETLDTR